MRVLVQRRDGLWPKVAQFRSDRLVKGAARVHRSPCRGHWEHTHDYPGKGGSVGPGENSEERRQEEVESREGVAHLSNPASPHPPPASPKAEAKGRGQTRAS